MSETVFYRGPSGTVIDIDAMKAELERINRSIKFHWDRGEPDEIRLREALDFPDESPVTFELYAEANGAPIGPLDSEQVPATERIEGLAKLLRRVLPQPAKVISTMSDEQWTGLA